MSSTSVEKASARTGAAPQTPPFTDSELMPGAVYAIGIETAAARLPLLWAPLESALLAGRPCVLITRLDPQDSPLREVLEQARRMLDGNAGDPARLQVLSAIGDYAVNLFLHGAPGYLAELDRYALAPGSLVLVDEADDLYTPHDHDALSQQARAYHAWCARHGHTMVQLHLRAGAHRPMLDGNQAAAQHLAGIARVTAQPEGLRLTVDFWASPSGLRIGSVLELEPRLPASSRPLLWYVGPPETGLDGLARQFAVRRAASVAEVLRWSGEERNDSLSIVVTLDPRDDFASCLEDLARLRAATGERAYIVVRESGFRLREFTQQRQLLRAGVDLVLPGLQPLRKLALQLPQAQAQRSVKAAAEAAAAPGDGPEPWVLESQAGPGSAGAAFADEVERQVRSSTSWQVPCALVEVELDDIAAGAAPADGAPRAGRKSDLSAATPLARFVFMTGCRGRDAVNAVLRGMGDELARQVRRIHLYALDSAIVERLGQLRAQTAPAAPAAAAPQDKSGTNVVTMSASSRAARGHLGAALLAALLAATGVWSDLARAQGAPAQTDVAATGSAAPTQPAASAAAYEQGRYEEAARLGLADLVREPENHALRLRVANSLAWTGRYRHAIEQYGRLATTPLANAATVGLANVHLWSGRPHLADPMFRRVLAADPGDAVAREGLANAQRRLRPRSTLRASRVDDSSRTVRRTGALAHRWRDESLMQVFELAGEHVDESRSPAGPDLQPRKASFEYQHLGLPLAPRVRLTSDSGVKSSFFAELALQVADAATVEIGRVNWGELAFAPDARRDGLFARRVGVAGQVESPYGGFGGSAAHFALSDGNGVHEFSARFTPAWQPFAQGIGLRASAGVYGRKAERHDPRYWSPASGYYVAQVGLALNRWGDDWNLSAELKRGLRLGGEGAGGWTAGFAGEYWVNVDWTVRVEGLHIETRRDGSAYRSTSFALSLDRLW